MSDLYTTHELVKKILEQKPAARNSDDLLYVLVCKEINPNYAKYPFETVMARRGQLGLPAFETVRRTRQKIQAENTALRASESVTDGRFEEYKEYKEYALS